MPVQAKAAARANESRLRKAKPEEKLESAGMMRWLLTYADMITLLLALFIILFSISTISKVKYQALVHDMSGGFNNQWAINNPPNGGQIGEGQGQQGEKTLQQLQQQIQQYVQQHNLQTQVQTRIERRGLVVTLLTNALYDEGSAELRPKTEALLNQVGGLLKVGTNDIRIEGYTDNTPISTSAYPTNWELSTARAVGVTRYLVEHVKIAPDRISASGFGEYRPKYPNDTPQHKQLNRRVEMVILSSAAQAATESDQPAAAPPAAPNPAAAPVEKKP
ncbi:MAG TPA: OmpA family protein [Candidatus Binatia bacterium]|nr:OmpA family protein [Candidatus Binatia bacterium]